MPESQEHPIIKRSPAPPRRRGDTHAPISTPSGRVPVERARPAESAPKPKPQHALRPEIQALRALAVALVVVSHLWPSALPGGFVGVDVFFAISGFLITSLLLREIDRSGRISLAAFWARRARRILPAALLTLLFVAVATIAFVPLNLWQQYFAELRASTGYVQNWHLAANAVDYFARRRRPVPGPALLVAGGRGAVLPRLAGADAARRSRSPAAARCRRRAIAAGMALLTVASLVYAVALHAAEPERRLLRHAHARVGVRPRRPARAGAQLRALARRRCARVLSWIGLAAIGAGRRACTRRRPRSRATPRRCRCSAPSRSCAPARPPAGWRADAASCRLRPVQFLGDISYSVYLWHWPLIVLAPFVLAPRARPPQPGSESSCSRSSPPGSRRSSSKTRCAGAGFLSRRAPALDVRRSRSRAPRRCSPSPSAAPPRCRPRSSKQARQTNAFLAKAPELLRRRRARPGAPVLSATPKLAKKVVPTPRRRARAAQRAVHGHRDERTPSRSAPSERAPARPRTRSPWSATATPRTGGRRSRRSPRRTAGAGSRSRTRAARSPRRQRKLARADQLALPALEEGADRVV